MRDEEEGLANGAAGEVELPIHPQRDGDLDRARAIRQRERADTRPPVAARLTRALADRLRESLARERALATIADELEPAASDAVEHVLRSRLSPAVHDVLRAGQGEAAVATATNLLNDHLCDEIEHQVIDALQARFAPVLRDRLDPTLGAAIVRSGGDVSLDAGAELALQLRHAAELGIRERLRDDLRSAIRDCVHGPARDRIAETLRSSSSAEPQAGAVDAMDSFASAITALVETAVHDTIRSAVRERIRAIVTNSVYEAVGARLADVVRPSWRVVHRGSHDDQRGRARTPTADDKRVSGESFGEHVRPYIAEAVREELTSVLRERLDVVARRAVEDTLRERLAISIRSALADQRRWDGLDLRRFGDAVRRQLGDALRERLNDALLAESLEVLRSRLDAAVQLGVARGAGSG